MLKRLFHWLTSAPPITHQPHSFKTIASTDTNFDDKNIDPLILSSLNRCIQTGRPVIGHRHHDGSFTITDVRNKRP